MSLPSVMSMPGKAWARISSKANEAASSDTPEPPAHAHSAQGEAEKKLVQNATLAIYGDRDGFVPVRKLRDWASRLEAVPDSKFRAHEVSSANHFWAQGNVASTLREAVRAFATSLLDDRAT
jgi:alpha/beta superfamily hydrolase